MAHLRPNSLPPQLFLLLLSLSAFSIFLLLVVPTPTPSSLEHLLPHALRPSGHPHHYQPLHLFDPEVNGWALRPFRKSSEFKGPGDVKEEGWEDGWRKVAGEGRGGLCKSDVGMVGLVFVGVGLSMFLNERRRRRGVRGVKGRGREI